MRNRWQGGRAAVLAMMALMTAADAQQAAFVPVQHRAPPPDFLYRAGDGAVAAFADAGMQVERDRGARDALAEHRRLAVALGQLEPQRPGVVDTYVLSVALDSDPVFGREAREAARVLARRYGADRRTLVLAGSDGTRASELPIGSPQALGAALAAVAERMDVREDVLVLFTTSHGGPFGIVYHDGDSGYGGISPMKLRAMLGELGFTRRLLIVNACYSGVFIGPLASDDSVIVTAAATDRSSFGCFAENDWTFFGDAFVNRALRKAQPIEAAFTEARNQVAVWETEATLTPSRPQVSIGAAAHRWLAAIDGAVPTTASAPVGRPTDISALVALQREARARDPR